MNPPHHHHFSSVSQQQQQQQQPVNRIEPVYIDFYEDEFPDDIVLKVLVVHPTLDEIKSTKLLEKLVEKENFICTFTIYNSSTEALESIDRVDYNLIFLSTNLSDNLTPQGFLMSIRNIGYTIPIVLIHDKSLYNSNYLFQCDKSNFLSLCTYKKDFIDKGEIVTSSSVNNSRCYNNQHEYVRNDCYNSMNYSREMNCSSCLDSTPTTPSSFGSPQFNSNETNNYYPISSGSAFNSTLEEEINLKIISLISSSNLNRFSFLIDFPFSSYLLIQILNFYCISQRDLFNPKNFSNLEAFDSLKSMIESLKPKKVKKIKRNNVESINSTSISLSFPDETSVSLKNIPPEIQSTSQEVSPIQKKTRKPYTKKNKDGTDTISISSHSSFSTPQKKKENDETKVKRQYTKKKEKVGSLVTSNANFQENENVKYNTSNINTLSQFVSQGNNNEKSYYPSVTTSNHHYYNYPDNPSRQFSHSYPTQSSDIMETNYNTSDLIYYTSPSACTSSVITEMYTTTTDASNSQDHSSLPNSSTEHRYFFQNRCNFFNSSKISESESVEGERKFSYDSRVNFNNNLSSPSLNNNQQMNFELKGFNQIPTFLNRDINNNYTSSINEVTPFAYANCFENNNIAINSASPNPNISGFTSGSQVSSTPSSITSAPGYNYPSNIPSYPPIASPSQINYNQPPPPTPIAHQVIPSNSSNSSFSPFTSISSLNYYSSNDYSNAFKPINLSPISNNDIEILQIPICKKVLQQS